MGSDTSQETGPGQVRQAVTGLRSRVAAVERALALGVLTVVVWSFVQFGVTLRILPVLIGPGGTASGLGGQVLSGVASQASLLVVLPALAWVLGLLVEGSPWGLGIGAAAVVEAFVLLVQYLSSGPEAILGRPVYLATVLLLGLGAGLLAAVAFRHGRGFIDARERARRRVAPPAAAAPEAPPSEAPPSADAPGGAPSGSDSSR